MALDGVGGGEEGEGALDVGERLVDGEGGDLGVGAEAGGVGFRVLGGGVEGVEAERVQRQLTERVERQVGD